MKRTIGLLVTAGLALSLAACSGSSTRADDKVSVGVLLPFSGESSWVGENTGDHGAKLAVDLANAHGGVLGSQVKMKVQDGEARPAAAVSGLKALLSDQVTVGIGPTSAPLPAALPILKKANTPFVPIASTSLLDTGLNGTYIWRTNSSDTAQFPAMFLAAAKLGGRVGLVFPNNASGQSQMTTAKKFSHLVPGIDVVSSMLLAPGQSSYQTEASQFFSHRYDAIIWQMEDVTAAGFFKSADQLGKIKGQHFIGADVSVAEATLKILKPYLGKADFTAVLAASAGPGQHEFTRLYKKAFKTAPPALADVGYDDVTMLLLAIEKAGSTDPGKISAAIPEVSKAPGQKCTSFAQCSDALKKGNDIDFEGASTTFDFNDNHNAVSPFAQVDVAADGTTSGADQIAIPISAIEPILDKAAAQG